MKVALALLCLCGVVLSTQAACSVAGCTLGTDITGSGACKTYSDFINCLNGQLGDCTDSVADTASRVAIKAAIDAATLTRDGLNCSAASRLTVTMMSLLIPVIVAFFRP